MIRNTLGLYLVTLQEIITVHWRRVVTVLSRGTKTPWRQINTYINKNLKESFCKVQAVTKEQTLLMYVYVYVHVCIRCMRCLCACVWTSEDSLGCSSSDCVHLDFWRQGLSWVWNSLSRLGWLPSKPFRILPISVSAVRNSVSKLDWHLSKRMALPVSVSAVLRGVRCQSLQVCTIQLRFFNVSSGGLKLDPHSCKEIALLKELLLSPLIFSFKSETDGLWTVEPRPASYIAVQKDYQRSLALLLLSWQWSLRIWDS